MTIYDTEITPEDEAIRNSSGEKITTVRRENHKFIVEGDAEKCSDKLGIDFTSFERAAERFKRGQYHKYRIYDVTDENRSLIRDCDRDVIKKWDDFVTPIRERYGIPVRHLGEGKK